MGGAVSSGRDNNELIDNLMGGNYIRTRPVERVFRSLDRADYMTPESRDQAYKDLAWRNGPLHMSAPCIYSEVLEGLELRPGLSFLNIGSGTGYFSTLVGLIIGPAGINHGIEVHPYVLEYAIKKLGQFIENSPTLDEFEFCEPKFYGGNGLSIPPLTTPYDRLYCGAGCPEQYQNYFKQLIKVGGVLVMPLNDNLVQIKRTAVDNWNCRSLLNVSFATLRVPNKDDYKEFSRPIHLDEQCPARLQVLSRAVVRRSMRAALLARHPHLREPPPRRPQPANSCPRRICIPIEDDSDVEGLNALHDLDHVNGANEMNALLSLVLSMGQNRVAGALRFDSLDSPSDSDDDDDDNDNNAGDGGAGDDGDEGGDGGAPRGSAGGGSGGGSGSGSGSGSGGSGSDGGDRPARPGRGARASRPYVRTLRVERPARAERVIRLERAAAFANPAGNVTEHLPEPDPSAKPARACRGLLTFEFQDDHRNLPRVPPRPPPARPERPADLPGAPDAPEAADAPGSSDVSGTSDTSTKTDDSSQSDPLKVPAEVEIYLGKEIPGTSRDMDWEATMVTNKEQSSSEEETTETSKEERKRKKLDSGIGEGTTTSSSSSPAKSGCCNHDHDVMTLSDLENDPNLVEGRYYSSRGPLKRSAQASGSSSEGSASSASSAAQRRRCKRRAAERRDAAPRPRRASADARRVRLSILMKRGVKELPLPYALKKYVNLGRCFEF
ncbi:hypothetical protein PYW08_003528 [Mythimna loreyi]|uniref:Uncharacterized protein n=1 Tax=Mythimna loreyi TaxID=667449 RepID=A0ACC2QVH6_9NEOP|nr:hypothetical protein PYW08_003528 [Mythimna loreyi]